MSAVALRGDVLAASGGDRAAFGRLVDASRGLVCGIALSIVRDVAASEDLAQEVFVAAWSGVRSLRNPDSFLPWLRQITRGRAIDWVRSRRRAPLVPADPDRLLSFAADPRGAPELLLLSAEERQIIAEAIEALPEEAREVVTLYYREGRSTAQVAALLELREDAVKKRLSRAREALREAAEERFGEALLRTAPGAAFTHAVLIGLPAGLPGAGAAATLAGGKLAKLLAVLGGGATLGAAGALGGLFLQRRVLLSRARDEEERRGIRRFALAQAAVVVLAGAGFLLVQGQPRLIMAILLGYIAVLAALGFGWYPRIIARRLAAERAEDPGAAARQRRHLILGVTGTVLTAAGAIAVSIWGLSHGG